MKSLPEQSDSDPMPVFILKAKDNLALNTVWSYRQQCLSAGLTEQADEVRKAYREIIEWRKRHPEVCQMPDHAHLPAGRRS